MIKIAAVITAGGDPEKLKTVLSALEGQTMFPREIVVVDCSGTEVLKPVLTAWEKMPAHFLKRIVSAGEQKDPAERYAKGFEEGIKAESDWLWVTDDSAVPQKDAFHKLSVYVSHYEMLERAKQNEAGPGKACSSNAQRERKIEPLSAVCTAVLRGGRTAFSERRVLAMYKLVLREYEVPAERYSSGKPTPLTFASAAGVLVSKEAAIRAGLPEKGLTAVYYDSEYTYRLSNEGKIMLLPELKTEVRMEREDENNEILPEAKVSGIERKTAESIYYEIRNRFYTYKKHLPWLQKWLMIRKYYPKDMDQFLKKEIHRAIHDGGAGKLGR